MADLGTEFRGLAESFAHMIQGLAYLDEDEAGRIAKKYSDELVAAARGVYKNLAEEMAVVLAKPPKKKRRSRKPVMPSDNTPIPSPTPSDVADIRAEANIGMEELPPQEETIRTQPGDLTTGQVAPEDVGFMMENLQNSLHSQNVTTGRSRGGYQESRTPPQKRIDDDD